MRVLLEAAARLRVPFTLTIVGAGRDEKRLRRRAASFAPGVVRFAGWQTDVAPFFAAADVVVVPSLWNEPFCLVGVEALAAGVPVVAFDRGGIGDWLKPDETGVFAPPTADGLARTLEGLSADPARLVRLSRTGAAFIRAHYSTSAFVEGILS